MQAPSPEDADNLAAETITGALRLELEEFGSVPVHDLFEQAWLQVQAAMVVHAELERAARVGGGKDELVAGKALNGPRVIVRARQPELVHVRHQVDVQRRAA